VRACDAACVTPVRLPPHLPLPLLTCSAGSSAGALSFPSIAATGGAAAGSAAAASALGALTATLSSSGGTEATQAAVAAAASAASSTYLYEGYRVTPVEGGAAGADVPASTRATVNAAVWRDACEYLAAAAPHGSGLGLAPPLNETACLAWSGGVMRQGLMAALQVRAPP
jgi:hypothetical protein